MKRGETYHPSFKDYESHYVNQTGRGGVYGGVRVQRGHGLGNILGGLFRASIPLLKTGAKAIGKKALQTGVKVANDVAMGNNLKQSLKRRAIESVGLTAPPSKKRTKSRAPARGRKRSPKVKGDIFR